MGGSGGHGGEEWGILNCHGTLREGDTRGHAEQLQKNDNQPGM